MTLSELHPISTNIFSLMEAGNVTWNTWALLKSSPFPTLLGLLRHLLNES